MKVLDVLEDTLVLENPEEESDLEKAAKRFGISPDNMDQIEKSKTGTKWQTTLLSRNSWYLIMYMSNITRFKGRDASDVKYKLDRWYKLLVEQVQPGEPISIFIRDASSVASVYVENQTAEEIVKELIGRMQNALGITIGPNWNAGGDTVKTAYREPYKDFLEVIGAPALADRAVKTQAPPVSAGSFEKGKEYIIVTLGNTDFTAIGAKRNLEDEQFIATGKGTGTGTAREADKTVTTTTTSKKPFTPKEANFIAGQISEIFGYFDNELGDSDDKALSLMKEKIKTAEQWKAVAKVYPAISKGDDLTDKCLREFNKERQVKFNKFLASLSADLAIDPKDLATYNQEADNTEITPKRAKELILDFSKKFLSKEPKYAKFVETSTGRKIWNGFLKNLGDDIKQELKKQKPPKMTIGKFREIWKRNTKTFTDTVDNIT
tara:strand:- start:480 stop:1784 length:1305 start_codon:yes stop_codon:yes gene_type:complete